MCMLFAGGNVIKRFVDITVSAALLLMALPVLALASLVIVCTSPGPVLFRQVRMGRDFRPFDIFKLRTMVHAQAGLAFTLGADPRITPVGLWLRRTKVDELPQLWNVLRGEMSLVGPRPVVLELTEEFREEYEFLLRARPGLTDPASLKYSQEARLLEQAADSMRFFKTVVTPDKIRISFEYMRQANFWTDAGTMAMTAVICCFPSMSRIYGELPMVLNAAETAEPQWKHPVRKAPVAVDGSIFAPRLACIEAAAEEAPKRRSRSWILLPNPVFKLRSASVRAKGSVSRL